MVLRNKVELIRTGLAVYAMLLIAGLLVVFLLPPRQDVDVVDLSRLDWQVVAQDAPGMQSGEAATADWKVLSGNGLPSASPEGILWFTATLPPAPDLVTPAILMTGPGDADQMFANGNLIGETGKIFLSARGYSSVGSAQVVRVYLLPKTVHSREVTITLRVQALLYPHVFDPAELLLGEANDLTRLAEEKNAPIRLRDTLILSILFVGAAMGLISASGEFHDARNRWIAPLFVSLAIAIFPATLPGYIIGLGTAPLAFLLEQAPIIPFALLHLATVTSTRIHPAQWLPVPAIYALAIIGWVADVPLPTWQILNSLQVILSIGVFAPSLVLAFKAWRQGRRVSPWGYATVLSVPVGILLYGIFGPLLPAFWDPLAWTVIAVVVFSLLAMGDHVAWDRQALHETTGHLLVAQDSERERLAKDLHDEVSHRLTAGRLRLEAMTRSDADIPPADLRPTIEDMRQLGLDVSALVEGLRPATLEAMTFSDAVAHAIDRWDRIGNLQFDVRIDRSVTPDLDVQLHVVRILQETLLNIARHAQATRVTLRLEAQGKTGRLLIQDNGKGFDPARTPRGVGITSMEQRARLIAATLRLKSTPGRGCLLEVEFPLP